MKSPKIKELRLRHYRAFSDARLVLDDMTFLVGRNGAGKSTLMDAPSFMSESVTDSVGTALERRDNLEGIRQRQPGKGNRFDVSIAVVLELEQGQACLYGFRLGTDAAKGSYLVKKEVLRGSKRDLFQRETVPSFERDREGFQSDDPQLKPVPDPEGLVFPLIAGGNPTWKQINEALRNISVHQFSPYAIRSEPQIGSEPRLSKDGSNAGDVLKAMNSRDRKWMEQRLSAVIPGLRGIKATARVGRRVIIFEQEGESGQVNSFDARHMSDGTVRSLGILLSLRQTPRPSIVLIDEIEDSLHPHAQGVLLDAINAASDDFPVVVSTHNPEILSHPTATGDRIRIVQWNEGSSRICQLSKEVMAGLRPPMTVGRLLRSNALWTEDEPSTTGAEADFFEVH
jgi:predicted ATPase